MTHPDEEHFNKQRCKEFFSYIRQHKNQELEQLIRSGADSDKCEQNHIRPLSFAINSDNVEAVKILLDYGCDLNFTDCFEEKALDYALIKQNKKIIELLQSHGAISKRLEDKHTYSSDNISQAASRGDLDALIYYQHLGSSLNQIFDNRTTLLHLCIESNNDKLLIYLLNKGLNIDARDKNGTTPLMLAAMHQSLLYLLDILIKRNATLNQRNNRHISALTMSIKRYNMKASELLIKNGADVNIRDGINTPLSLTHSALNNTDDKNFQEQLRHLQTLLFSKNAHVNGVEEQLQWSPLMLTASHYQDNSNLKHMELLIRLGANINQIDRNSRTALMVASSLGRIKAIEILMKHNAKLNISDKFGWTALMLAVYYNQKETIITLLDNGADVNFYSKKNLTALKIAIDNDRNVIIPILKEYGAVSPQE